MSGESAAGPRWKSPSAFDALCLAAITIGSALPYLGQLGFYSDDWGLLAAFHLNHTASVATLIADNFPSRPIQGLYLLALFHLFGLEPLSYHIVNTAMLAAGAALLYLLLRRLRFSRSESFAATVVFVMLPQLSTVRVWYAAFQIPLSMMLMLLSMHGLLSYHRSGNLRWLAAALAAAVLSVASYEIFAPLLAAFAAAIVFDRWRWAGGDRRTLLMASGLAVLVLGAFAYKLASGRAGAIGDAQRYVAGVRQLIRTDYDWRVDSGLNIFAMLRACFLDPARGWWMGAEALITGQAGATVAVPALVIGALAWWRLSSSEHVNEPLAPKRLLLLGIATFLAGHATFLVVPSIAFTSTGLGNRVQVAAAIGAAMIIASLVGLTITALPSRVRGAAFATFIVAVTVPSFVRLDLIERYWAEAPALQRQVLSSARVDLRHVPGGSTVILDGVCPYHGPAVVFEAGWDVGGALTLALGRPIDGNAVSARMRPTVSGLETSIYKEPTVYPYGARLFVYNPAKHLLLRLGDAATAARYFASRRANPCPGFVARGVEV